jgi:glycosyltransferase involved in cell wall biosynthesis
MIHILNYEPDRIGGGWQAARYLFEGLGCTSDYASADTILITGPTMASHDQVEQAKRDGKKIVLRVDNAVRDSRNRGTGMTRLKAFSEMADLVVYQSQWARNFLYPFIKKDGAVILNGVDTKLFHPPEQEPELDSYLYVRSSRDEGKNWIGAWYWFANNRGKLTIIGKFSPDNFEWKFDFFNDEKILFLGEQSPNVMPDIFRSNKYFLYSYICDAGSNTLLEARASGCEVIDVFGALKSGCGPEYMAMEDITIERMIKEYKEAINELV